MEKNVERFNFGFKCDNMSKDFYFNESHVKANGSNSPFSPQNALEEMVNFRNQINQWEQARLNLIRNNA